MSDSMRSVQKVDVLIVGGGMVGLAMACALREQPDVRVMVVERREIQPQLSLGSDMRVSAIIEGTANILRGMGVWDQLQNVSESIQQMRVWDQQEVGGARFEALEVGLQELGRLVPNSEIQYAMLNVLADCEHIDVYCPAHIESINFKTDAVYLSLDQGQHVQASLVVGADGAQSWLREQAGISHYQRDYAQKAIVANVRPQQHHRNTAYQRFLAGGPLAFLPLPKGLCSIVWSLAHEEAEQYMQLDDALFLDELNLAFGPVLGRIEEVGERGAFPLVGRLSQHFVQHRLALIGDAAHVIHPLAGLGVNLGIRDAIVLAQEVAMAIRYQEDPGSMDVLALYRKNRVPDVLSVMASMEAFHHVFTSKYAVVGKLRRAGMLMFSNSGALKKSLMRTAMGLNLAVPANVMTTAKKQI
ncbi:MAG: UbiH/UbiF/VisC/COQ6 family ubiquinone biosynthesis hydroxylase [Mariprofundaceae bacterium]|nr:UbiH/UbiF/VisC/COQ6 family ubiquinone biosynthesis hydroxylase [Mariprofundaceae bacterium]